MRGAALRSVWLAILALLGLSVVVTGCADSADRGRDGLIDATSVKTGDPVFVHGTIEGIITGDTDEIVLPAGRIVVFVRNRSNGVLVAESYMSVKGPASFPIPFEVECDPCRFYPDDNYVAHATFEDGDNLGRYYSSGMDALVLADDRLAKDVEIRMVESAIITGTQKVTFTFDADEISPKVKSITLDIVDPLTKLSVAYESFSLEVPRRLPSSLVFACDPFCAVHPNTEYVANVLLLDQEGYHLLNSRKTTVIADGKFATHVEIPMMPAPFIDVTIAFNGSNRVPDDVEGYLYLKDVSRKGGEPKIVGDRRIFNYHLSDDSPFLFSLYYHPADIDLNGTYMLDLDLKANEGRACHAAYTTKAAPRVLTKGNPSDDIQMEMISVDRPQSPTDYLTTVSGTIRLDGTEFDDRDPSSYWQIRLMDVTRDCVAAHLEVKELDSLPYPFSLSYNPSEVDPSSFYVVSVYKSLSPFSRGLLFSLQGESEERFTFIDGRPSNRDRDVILKVQGMFAD